MKRSLHAVGLTFLLLCCAVAVADEYEDTIKVFREAGASGAFFGKSYGYAVFPTIGKGGVGIGAAHGTGRVYAGGKYVGDTSMTQITAGLQLGGQAFSQIIFFEDKRAFDEFTGGNFEFGAQAMQWRSPPALPPARRRLALRPVPAAAGTMRPPSASTTRAWRSSR